MGRGLRVQGSGAAYREVLEEALAWDGGRYVRIDSLDRHDPNHPEERRRRGLA